MRLRRQIPQYLLLAALFGLLSIFLLYPIALTLQGAFFVEQDLPAAAAGAAAAGAERSTVFSLRNFDLLFRDPVVVEGLLNALKIAAATTALSVALGLPLAILSVRSAFPLKGLWNALILVPLILPPFVGAIGMRMLLGREGAINSLLGTDWDILGAGRFWGVVVVQALHLYPIIYLNASAALANLDPAMDEAAENLGAGFWRRLTRITLPLVRPGLFAGGTIVFIWAFTELGAPLVFDYTRVTSVQIFNGLKEVETNAQPYALTVVLLVSSITLYLVGKHLLGGRAHAMHAKASRAASERSLSPLGAALATAAFAGVSVLALLPHLGVILTAIAEPGTWYRSALPTAVTSHHFVQALTHPDAFGAISNSLKLSAIAVVFNLLVGLVVGYLVVRTTIRGRGALDALCMLPLAVPGLVMAFGYVAMSLNWPLGKGDPLHAFASVLGTDPNPFPLLIAAYAVRRLPYVVRSAVAGLEQTSGTLEEAALNLGASRLTTMRRVVVPLISANLIAGGLLAFAFSMLEVSDSLLLAQKQEHFPITKAIYSFTNRLADGPYIASAMGVWGMALLAVTLVGASLLMGRRLGAIFRV